MESYYQWLYLPPYCAGMVCEMELSRQGINVFGAERFLCGNKGMANAVRIATCSAKDEGQLRKGLESVKDFIRCQERADSSFIV